MKAISIKRITKYDMIQPVMFLISCTKHNTTQCKYREKRYLHNLLSIMKLSQTINQTKNELSWNKTSSTTNRTYQLQPYKVYNSKTLKQRHQILNQI